MRGGQRPVLDGAGIEDHQLRTMLPQIVIEHQQPAVVLGSGAVRGTNNGSPVWARPKSNVV